MPSIRLSHGVIASSPLPLAKCPLQEELQEAPGDFQQEINPSTLTAETFWPTFAELHRQPLSRSFEQPWLFAAVNAARRLSPESLEREPLASFARQLREWVMTIVKRGQAVGVIRDDIPDELIFAWLQALDAAGDQWLLAHWQDLDLDAIARASDQTVDAMRRALAPDALS